MSRKRNRMLGIRLSDEEWERVHKKILKSKLSQREFLLRAILNKDIIIKEGGLDVVRELKAIGNNLNQLTRKVNSGEITDCSEHIANIHNKLKELMIIWQ